MISNLCKVGLGLALVVLLGLVGCVDQDKVALLYAQEYATLTAGPVMATWTETYRQQAATGTAESLAIAKAQADEAFYSAAARVTEIAGTQTQVAAMTEEARLAISATAEAERAAAAATAEAVRVRATEQAEREQAQATAAAQMTGTAQAWLVVEATLEAGRAGGTSTAVAAMGQGTATASAGAWYRAQTQQAVDLAATVQAGQAKVMAADAAGRSTERALETFRAEAVNSVTPWLGLMLVAIVVGYGLWLVARFGKMEAARAGVVLDPLTGAILAVLDERQGKLAVMLPGKSVGPSMLSSGKDGVSTVAVGDELWRGLQADVTRRDQMVAALRAMPEDLAASSARGLLGLGEDESAPAALPAGDEVMAAEWKYVDGFKPGTKMLLGVGPGNGKGPNLLTVDVQAASSPHLLVAGQSGTGKSRYCLRTLVASALVNSWQTLLVGRSPLNFKVFGNHPNARSIQLSEDDPGAVLDILKSLYRLIVNRKNMLDGANQTTWDRWGRRPGPPVVVVLSELANLYDELKDTNQHTDLWRWVRMAAREGRAAGVYLASEVQDPVKGSIDLAYRRQSTPVVFRTNDPTACQGVFGFETTGLPDGRFKTVAGGLVVGEAFNPKDEQIEAWLQANPVRTWEPIVFDVPGREPVEDWREKARRMKAEGKGVNEIAIAIFGYSNGRTCAQVNAATTETTTVVTTTTGGTGVVGGVVS